MSLRPQNLSIKALKIKMPPPTPLAPVVAVLNMKGGVGKTTVSAHLMRHLFERLHKSTLLVDFDPQFNLSQTVLSRSRYESLRDKGTTVATIMEPMPSTSLFKITTNLGPPPDEDQVSTTLFRFGSSGKTLALVPGHFGLSKYSLITDQQSLTPIRQRFLNFIENSRKTRDLVCIDCNPSSSFMTLCALMASTHILIPVRPDRYSILGLQLLDQFISELAQLTKKPKLIILLNGMKLSNSTEIAVETSLRSDAKFGPMVLGNTLRFSGLLAADDNYVGFATDKKVAHVSALKTRLSKITDELKGHLGWQ
ncbi:chromosome partitioning protein [Variovorax boronicumulans]|uniref:ParA family protein n=1 Tax=Variovorax boronicumulans TaxID=436515 RepID=UPI00277F6563|nr:ParA family protein [Variovorax boronicumulans]MDP9990378.1 chromosome partitioning protein [Variovorax boronicumulans]MDQ0001111.1 chromosome partitioning protein [Variovorax boronicumulans]